MEMPDVILEELGLTEEDIAVENYETMTREELIACLNAADAHHQEHHQWQDDLRRENEELKARSNYCPSCENQGKKIAELKEKNKFIQCDLDDCREYIDELQAKLDKAEDALRFYGDESKHTDV